MDSSPLNLTPEGPLFMEFEYLSDSVTYIYYSDTGGHGCDDSCGSFTIYHSDVRIDSILTSYVGFFVDIRGKKKFIYSQDKIIEVETKFKMNQGTDEWSYYGTDTIIYQLDSDGQIRSINNGIVYDFDSKINPLKNYFFTPPSTNMWIYNIMPVKFKNNNINGITMDYDSEGYPVKAHTEFGTWEYFY